MTLPLVSCIMPTADRLEFVLQSVRYFQAQTYPNKELLILDDGQKCIQSLLFPLHVLEDLRIHRARSVEKMKLGAKRNALCSMASGDLIAHWDDDDWYAPDYLASQIGHLGDTHEALGVGKMLFADDGNRCAWRYQGSDAYSDVNNCNFVTGCSLVYRRSLWESVRFAEVGFGEDGLFASAIRSRIKVVPSSLVIARVHPRNTVRKRTDDRRFFSPVGYPSLAEFGYPCLNPTSSS